MTIQSAHDTGKLIDLQLVTDESEVKEIVKYLGRERFAKYKLIGGLYVGQKDGDYTRVYGFRGSIPYLEKDLYLMR